MNGKQNLSGGLHMDMGHEKTSEVGYQMLLEASGFHHSNSGLQIAHDTCTAGYFMILFDLTSDRCASEGHMSHPDNVNIRIELKFKRYYLVQ